MNPLMRCVDEPIDFVLCCPEQPAFASFLPAFLQSRGGRSPAQPIRYSLRQ